jgi:hypothetical protein
MGMGEEKKERGRARGWELIKTENLGLSVPYRDGY